MEKLAAPSESDVVFEIRDPDSVHAYIEDHPQISPILVQMREQVFQRFGYKAEVALEIYSFGKSPPVLHAIVVTHYRRCDADPIFEAMDQDWWFPLTEYVGDCLALDMEYGDVDL